MERYPTAGGANPIVRVLVAPLNGAESRVMDIGGETDIYIPRVNWLTDSKHIAIQRLNRAQTMLELLIADASTGKSRMILNQSDANWINISDDLYFLKDGKRFLWSSEQSGYRHLYLYDLEGKQLAQLTKGDWEVSAVDAVDETKGLVYFTATEKSPRERHVYRVALDGTGFTRVTKEEGTHAAVFAPNSAAFYDTYSNIAAPPRQDLFRADGSRIATINENKIAELADYHLSPMEFVAVKSRDGVQLNASLIKPPNFDAQKKYPVLVYTYGGPHAQVVRNAWGGANFLWHELMAQKGYIIFSLDNRGSAGRGHAFETPLHFRMGAQELSDQRDGVQYLKSLPYVDASRIGIWGWSYGGHMTLHAMFEAGDDFKAGFAGGPVTDWRYYDSIYTERYLGLPQKNEKGYQDSSPVKYAAQLKGKLMIAHGTGDDNVHFANTLAVINDLIETGKYVEVLAFPGRGHGVSDPPARRILMQRVTQFFIDNL
jgi:dipeptidyl-peptidase-4